MLNRLKKFSLEHPPILFSYLFGSQARDKVDGLSDVDVAVYLSPAVKARRRFDYRLELIADISFILKRNDVDLLILNDMNNILLAFEVIGGKLIDSKDDDERICYEARVMSRYYDQKYYIDRHTQLALDRIANKGFS